MIEVKGRIEEGKDYILQVNELLCPLDFEDIRNELKLAYPNSKFLVIVGDISIYGKEEFVNTMKEAGII